MQVASMHFKERAHVKLHDERLQHKIDSIYRPIVVSLPIKETLHVGEDHRAYLSRLIRRAIGFDITLRRG